MSDIKELESRLAAALDRIGAGLDGLGAVPEAAAAPDDGTLSVQLEEERTANAQLVERVKALKERQESTIDALEARVSAQADQMAQLDAELQRLRASNADLRQVNAQLRSAASDGAADPEMINRAMMAEIEALQAQRSADAAEVDAILAELKPLVEEATHAAG